MKTNILIGLLVVLASLSALEKYVSKRVASGKDIGFSDKSRELGAIDSLILEGSSGEDSCFVNLKLDKGTLQFSAFLCLKGDTADQTELSIYEYRSDNLHAWYRIVEGKPNARKDTKFVWKSGHQLIVGRPTTGRPSTLHDWIIELGSGETDSRSQSRNRSVANWILLVSAVGTVLLATYKVIEEQRVDRGPFTGSQFFERVIAGLGVPRLEPSKRLADAREPFNDNKIIRLLLRYVFVNRYSPVDAIKLLRLPKTVGFQAWFTAIALIKGPLEYFRTEIDDALRVIEDTRNTS